MKTGGGEGAILTAIGLRVGQLYTYVEVSLKSYVCYVGIIQYPTSCNSVLETKALNALPLSLRFAQLTLDVAGIVLRALILKRSPKFTSHI